MWAWVFVLIAGAALLWHGTLVFVVAKKAKRLLAVAQPTMDRLNLLNAELNQRISLPKPELAIDTNLDDLMVRRMLLLRKRAARKAQRERRLLDRLQQIDPTERRFTRDKRT